MASRQVTAQRRAELVRHLTELVSSGTTTPGDAIPSIRSLAEQFDLSQPTVLRELRPLIDSGILRSVPGVGIYIAHRDPRRDRRFVFAREPTDDEVTSHLDQIRAGFERRITELGGVSLVLSADQFLDPEQTPLVNSCAGVFLWRLSRSERDPRIGRDKSVHYVLDMSFNPLPARAGAVVDHVGNDDVEGGHQAALHLIRAGHRRIAYFGLHGVKSGIPPWSSRREQGWRRAMRSIGQSDAGLSYGPTEGTYDRTDQRVIATALAEQMLQRRSEFTAVICAGSLAVVALIDVWRKAGVPYHEWPALVGFENVPGTSSSLLTTSMSPAWDAIGRTAAQLLWERASGTLTGGPTERRVPIMLSSRMTSHQGWADEKGMSAIIENNA